MAVKSTQASMTFSSLWPVLSMIVLAGLSRLIPHPPNFTAVIAMALLAGVSLSRLSWAVLVPIFSLAMGDLVYGFHSTLLAVYFAIIAVVLVAFRYLKEKSFLAVAVAAPAASLWFWVVTNFSVWLQMDLYSKDLTGLTTCYLAAVPFLEKQVLGDLFFTAILFSLYSLFLKIFSAKTYSSI